MVLSKAFSGFTPDTVEYNVSSTNYNYDLDSNGVIDDDVNNTLKWEPLIVTPYDLVIFDAWVPHRSATNTTNKQRRAFYFTFNKLKDGDFYDKYFDKKKVALPPDFEREEGIVYNLNSKYNLANPIS